MLKTKIAALAVGLNFAVSIAAADTFILVHGAFQDATGWARVAEGLH